MKAANAMIETIERILFLQRNVMNIIEKRKKELADESLKNLELVSLTKKEYSVSFLAVGHWEMYFPFDPRVEWDGPYLINLQ